MSKQRIYVCFREPCNLKNDKMYIVQIVVLSCKIKRFDRVKHDVGSFFQNAVIVLTICIERRNVQYWERMTFGIKIMIVF